MGTTIILGIISIGILIFVHELGHFLAARAGGIKVEVFSIGWGRGVVSFKWKETKVQIGWIPFGGYCKMAGDSPRDDLTGDRGEYYSSPPLRRIMVALSGPLFNYLFAALLFIMIVFIGYEIKTYPNRILLADNTAAVTGGSTPAKAAGMRDGDVIIEINGNGITNWDQITENIVRNALKPVRLKVLREGTVFEFTVVPRLEEETGRGIIGIYPWIEPVIGETEPAGAADLAGLRKGDRIISVDGVLVDNHLAFYSAIEGKANEKVAVVFGRNQEIHQTMLFIRLEEGYESAGLFFRQQVYRSPKYPFGVSVVKGFKKSGEAVRDTVRGIGFVISGKIRARNAVAGPAKLIYLSGQIAKEGFVYFLQVMGYISIAFFIMNLIPFPALDGSHIVISLYEVVTRKRPNLSVIHRIQAFGFIVLIAALVFVTMNDITSFLNR
ncbi:MAG: RIP metalloprotease RseP [Spirochaetes bacterium]|nr:RIP metalloprotease RseP [Spirochaetota bacterium]